MKVGAVLRLVRPPNVFTAFADAMAGLLVVRALGVTISDSFLALIAASGCLYLSGIVLNDVFDREVDAVERPNRPIPSGDVSLRFAIAMGTGLLATGVVLAFMVSSASGVVAVALAAAILAYDSALKHTSAGPFSMGSCRLLNFTLGLSPLFAIGADVPWQIWFGPLLLGSYIVALTYIARDEVQGNALARVRRGLTGMAAVFICAGVVLMFFMPDRPMWAMVWFGALAGLAFRNWAPLWQGADGPSTGRAIGGGIVLIPVIDAVACAAAGEPFWAISVAAMIFPAMALKKYFYST